MSKQKVFVGVFRPKGGVTISEKNDINWDTFHGITLYKFDGYPYLVSKVAGALYHIILLPSALPEDILKEIAHFQAVMNKLQTCLVLGERQSIYFNLDGSSEESDFIPRGNCFEYGKLLSCINFQETEEFCQREERLKAFIDSLNVGEFVLLGDLTKGGRKATEEEIQRLSGTQPDGVPRGLVRCKVCGCWAGECLDPNPEFKGMVMKVHCLCQNDNLCARCGQKLYEYKLNANYYGKDGQIWHVPGFSGFGHRCPGYKQELKMKLKIKDATIWISEAGSSTSKGFVICNGEPKIEYLGILDKLGPAYKIHNPVLFGWVGEIEKIEDSPIVDIEEVKDFLGGRNRKS